MKKMTGYSTKYFKYIKKKSGTHNNFFKLC